MTGRSAVVRADARRLPLADGSVDLICTSPPYWSLRTYTDNGSAYDGQIGSEAEAEDYLHELYAVYLECVRVLKPTGSIFWNLGDKYGPNKSLMLLPHRFADMVRSGKGGDAGIVRAEIIWSKPNGLLSLPESVTDRVRRSHEVFWHFVKEPRYFSAVDEVREPHVREWGGAPNGGHAHRRAQLGVNSESNLDVSGPHPLGKLPGSVWTIPTAPLRVPEELGVDHFACVDAETEILTRRGWLRHESLKDDDEVAGTDLDTGLTRWTRLHGIHRYDYDGELVTADARGLSMRLTPNHRTPVHRYAGRHRYRQPVEVIRADEVTSLHGVPRSVEWVEDGREKSIGPDLAAMFGWVAAEGWYKGESAVYLSQSLTANPDKVAEIDALIDRLGLGYFSTRERQWRGEAWTDAVWRLDSDLAADLRRIMPDKLLPAWLADLPLAEASALLEAFISGDGHRRPDGRRAVFQKERHNLDVLQVLAVRLGLNTTLKNVGGRWVLYLNPPRPARLRQSDGKSLVGREHYKGTVWCVTTGTGTFVARRAGTVFVTGNSFPPEFPRRIILGWSPSGVCEACGEGRRPAARADGYVFAEPRNDMSRRALERALRYGVTADEVKRLAPDGMGGSQSADDTRRANLAALAERIGAPSKGGGLVGSLAALAVRSPGVGYACACPDTTAPTRPAVVIDPFGGTGTTAMVARALGRTGLSFDLSHDYSRLARWRTEDAAQRAKVRGEDFRRPEEQLAGQLGMFEETA